MNISSKLRNLRVAIVTHEYATGPSHSLEKYLLKKVAKLTFIAHPFVFAKEKRSHMRNYSKSQKSKEIFFPLTLPVQNLNIIKDVLVTFWWILKNGKVDLFIGVDNVNACIGVILQKFGLVKKTVFYTIDYIPQRFTNSFLNSIYHFFDAYAVENTDISWNLSLIMAKERAKVGLTSPSLRHKQIVVPVGTDLRVTPRPFAKIQRYHLAHMGHLTEKQGVQLVIEAIPLIKRRLPLFHLDILGGGPMENKLKELAKKFEVEQNVTFYGFIKDHDEVERLLANSAAAIAPYRDSRDNFVRYTDPGKVKAYLAAGLPIIITRVPDIWKLLVNKEAGIAVSDNPKAIAEGVIWLLSEDKRLQELRRKASVLGREFNWTKVFDRALSQTL